MDRDEIELLPCPFCGGAAKPALRIGFPVSASCSNCNAEGPSKLTAREANEAWNDRVDESDGPPHSPHMVGDLLRDQLSGVTWTVSHVHFDGGCNLERVDSIGSTHRIHRSAKSISENWTPMGRSVLTEKPPTNSVESEKPTCFTCDAPGNPSGPCLSCGETLLKG